MASVPLVSLSQSPEPADRFIRHDSAAESSSESATGRDRPADPSAQSRTRPAAAGSSNWYSNSSESDHGSPLLPKPAPSWQRRRQAWWQTSDPGRKRSTTFRWLRRALRKVTRYPYFPARPLTIALSFLAFGIFALSLTKFLMWYLNPDKEPLPWRAYCSVPSPYTSPHIPHMPSSRAPPPVYSPPFPPPNLESLAPAGVFLGVFSMDSSLERRMLVRTTWAGHPRSRNGAGIGDSGNGTSRTIVRFILGRPKKAYEPMIQMEMEKYGDIVILPIHENMNGGKTHAFFSWAANGAWVPPPYFASPIPLPAHSYSDLGTPAPPLAVHDPALAHADTRSNPIPKPWVRPDMVLKCDDDSFVMLAELEARVRVELHSDVRNATAYWADPPAADAFVAASATPAPAVLRSRDDAANTATGDPLIYWGYLIKNRFMGGEIYGMSWALVQWVSEDEGIKSMTHGAEDKQTAKWMNAHPRHEEIRWKSERCWIYNHPRSGTVYSHGFLFPSEVTRVKRALMSYLGTTPQDVLSSPWLAVIGANAPTPAAWAQSSVSTFGVRYTPPLADLSASQTVEALVEGSEMSLLRAGSPMTREYAWTHREGRARRYGGARVGGTVVVHFIKEHAWFLETALALLEGEEVTDAESKPARSTLSRHVEP